MVHACGAVPRYTCRGIRSARFCSKSLPPHIALSGVLRCAQYHSTQHSGCAFAGAKSWYCVEEGWYVDPRLAALWRRGWGGGGILHDCTGGCKC